MKEWEGGWGGGGWLSTTSPALMVARTISVPMQMRTMAIAPKGRGTFARMKSKNGVSSGMLAVSA